MAKEGWLALMAIYGPPFPKYRGGSIMRPKGPTRAEVVDLPFFLTGLFYNTAFDSVPIP